MQPAQVGLRVILLQNGRDSPHVRHIPISNGMGMCFIRCEIDTVEIAVETVIPTTPWCLDPPFDLSNAGFCLSKQRLDSLMVMFLSLPVI